MIIVRQNMGDYARWASRLGKGFGAAIQRGTVSGAARCIPIMQERTRTAPPANPSGVGEGGAVNTGSYLGAWRSSALSPAGASVFNNKLHAAIIEEGRRAGGRLPPLRFVARWAQRRLGLSEKEAKRAAFPMARAIAARGLRPRRVMADGLEEMIDAVEEEQVRELDAALEERSG